jgi:hypothetical protein
MMMFDMKDGRFTGIFTGQTKQARRFALDNKLASAEELALMSKGDVDDLISKRYIAVVLLSGVVDGGDGAYEEIYLIPKNEWGKFAVIKR